jgi:hypothetical protein
MNREQDERTAAAISRAKRTCREIDRVLAGIDIAVEEAIERRAIEARRKLLTARGQRHDHR